MDDGIVLSHRICMDRELYASGQKTVNILCRQTENNTPLDRCDFKIMFSLIDSPEQCALFAGKLLRIWCVDRCLFLDRKLVSSVSKMSLLL